MANLAIIQQKTNKWQTNKKPTLSWFFICLNVKINYSPSALCNRFINLSSSSGVISILSSNSIRTE